MANKPIQDQTRRALITGGASGFGLAIANALLAQGARVAIGDIDSESLQEAVRTVGCDDLMPLDLDVTSPASVRAAVDACQTRFGGLDALVNSAGVIEITPFLEIREEEWDRIIDVDLKGTFLACQAAAPFLCESGHGRIVNIGSDASRMGWPLISHYVAAKFGVVGLTKSLAGELAEHQVTVNCVCPIATASTGMGQKCLRWKVDAMNRSESEVHKATAAAVPLKRNSTEADVVNAVMFFLADSSSFLTGQVLDVDGGMLSTASIPGSGEE